MTFGGDMGHDIDTDPCCCMVRNPDTALSNRTGWDFTMVLGGFVTHTHQVIPLYLHIFRSVSLHRAQKIQLLFLYHLSTPYLYIRVAHAVGRPCIGRGL